MTTQIFHGISYFDFAELIEWGYETGGDFDEALRVYSEKKAQDGFPQIGQEIAAWSGRTYDDVKKRFDQEFRS